MPKNIYISADLTWLNKKTPINCGCGLNCSQGFAPELFVADFFLLAILKKYTYPGR